MPKTPTAPTPAPTPASPTVPPPVATPSPTPSASPSPISLLDNACEAVKNYRNKPLLVLYYTYRAKMTEDDLDDVYQAFRDEGLKPDQRLDELDVLIESYGGDPVAGYRLAQLIRDFGKNINFLVPSHAYSAATILCFAGNEVRLGHYAGLSPIDLSLVSASEGSPNIEIELASIDSFMEFAGMAREQIERLLSRLNSEGKTQIDSDLLVKMVDEIGALQIGKYFRERNLTGVYAKELLRSYMFEGLADANDRTDFVLHHFLSNAPSHQFHMDYHLCKKQGLKVEEMNTEESDLIKEVSEIAATLTYANVICPRLPRGARMPFFRFYPR